MIALLTPHPHTHPQIMGELTFTCAMVVLLRALNISCIASTTYRNVVDDADGKKIVTFSFVQFREY